MKGVRSIARETLVNLKDVVDNGKYKGNAKVSWCEGVLHAEFSDPGDVHQLVVPVDGGLLVNGYTLKVKIQGWKNLRYLALGYMPHADNTYVHVKVPNPKQGAWIESSVSHNDVVFRLQNNWSERPPTSLSAIRVFIKGVADGQAELCVAAASIWLEQGGNSVTCFEKVKFNTGLVKAIVKYWGSCYPEYEKQASDFLERGVCPIGAYPVMANRIYWSPKANRPVSLNSPSTHRYIWHALNPVAVLILAYERSPDNRGLLCAARELVSDWMRESFFCVDEDQKYCWYDHGAAERTLVLVVMYELGIRHRFDYRFMARLFHVLIKHAQLMQSEAFYASHQHTRYHNHAWFQDIALMASAIAFHERCDTSKWLLRGMERLADQFDVLIVKEREFSVFTENSIGYHNGIIRIVEFASQVAMLSRNEGAFAQTANELARWAEAFVYPGGRVPGQGDTFRRENPAARSEVVVPANWIPSCICLPKAGYVVIRGGKSTCPWMFSFLGTNLNSTHKHEDDLSFTLWLDGVEWLIDPSFYSHEYKSEIPAFLRSAAAHNSLFIRDLAYSIEPFPGRVSLTVEESEGEEGKRCLSIFGSSHAYDGYVVERVLKCANGSGTFFLEGTDRYCASVPHDGKVNACLSFHFGDGVKVERVGDSEFELSHPASPTRLRLVLNWKVSGEDMDVRKSFSGLGYMQSVETVQLLIGLPLGADCSWAIYANA